MSSLYEFLVISLISLFKHALFTHSGSVPKSITHLMPPTSINMLSPMITLRRGRSVVCRLICHRSLNCHVFDISNRCSKPYVKQHLYRPLISLDAVAVEAVSGLGLHAKASSVLTFKITRRVSTLHIMLELTAKFCVV